MAKLTFLWYDNFGKNQTPLQRNGMAAIPIIVDKCDRNCLTTSDILIALTARTFFLQQELD